MRHRINSEYEAVAQSCGNSHVASRNERRFRAFAAAINKRGLSQGRRKRFSCNRNDKFHQRYLQKAASIFTVSSFVLVEYLSKGNVDSTTGF